MQIRKLIRAATDEINACHQYDWDGKRLREFAFAGAIACGAGAALYALSDKYNPNEVWKLLIAMALYASGGSTALLLAASVRPVKIGVERWQRRRAERMNWSSGFGRPLPDLYRPCFPVRRPTARLDP